MDNKRSKPRCVIVFDSEENYREFDGYAKQKGFLDLKNFFTVSAKHYMVKYPQKTGSNEKGV
jgi:hypothetical protein